MRKKLVVVLGMHRSGTSAVARGMQVLGVSLGQRLAPAMADNEKGFWEDVDITSLDIEMLHAIGRDWHHVAPITEQDVDNLKSQDYFARAADLLSEKISGHENFGVKDPRISKLLPFWEQVFGQLDLDVSYILAIRNPLSVQRSLSARNQLDPAHSYLLWLGHVLESLRRTFGASRVLVDFDRLLSDPEKQLLSVAERFGLQVDGHAMAEYRSGFLDDRLRHSYCDVNELDGDAACPRLAREVYTELLKVADGEAELDSNEFLAQVEDWTQEFDRLSSMLNLVDRLSARMAAQKTQALVEIDQLKVELDETGVRMQAQQAEALAEINVLKGERDAVITERDSVAAQLDGVKHERDAVIRERDTLFAQINTIWSSFSWRVTRPLRLAARLVRHGYTRDTHAQLVERMRYYYRRLPIPWKAKQFVSRLYHRRISKSLNVAHQALMGGTRFDPPKVYPAAQQMGKPDYLFWGVIDWHFRHQRPQHLAESLAKTGRRVFYVSPVMTHGECAGFEVESLDTTGSLFQIKLYAKNPPQIYSDPPGLDLLDQLASSIGEVLNWAASTQLVSLVQHPFWHGVASVLPNSRLVYDCMDHHEGFGDSDEPMLALERALFNDAELTVVTSKWLEEAVGSHARRSALIRNAGEYEHFAPVPAPRYQDPEGRKVIGYYGAIAEWFDANLVEGVAKQHPDCSILLIGADTANVKAQLGRLPNVSFLGEKPYAELPFYLHGFDVCMLPFKVVPLTLATNPVKAYEYLSAGKPVVTTDLPEMSQFGDLVYRAGETKQFLQHLRTVLERGELPELIRRRQELASQQTWLHRVQHMIDWVEDAVSDPWVSVIVVTYNNLNLTKACLYSLEQYTQFRNLEIIVVDNASADGTDEYLNTWVAVDGDRHVILNNDNKGFAAANNQGLQLAKGDYLVMLNNDTYVTPGWVRTMVGHLRRDGSIGMLGPVTNNIGNEAKIDISYHGMTDMLIRSAAYTQRHLGQTYPLRTAAFFCVMMPRSVYERIGLLDEAFGQGFFEDDDYCRRIEKEGLRIVCAEDVFIHHHLSASFDKLKQSDRQRLFEKNKTRYEEKWGQWIPHGYRQYRKPDRSFSTLPKAFENQQFMAGACNVCGKPTRFFYTDVALWRESLNCEQCRTTSRYRSITRGILRAIEELRGVKADSLAVLPHLDDESLVVYDTQPPFYYETCAYPLPDLLKNTGWIKVELSQYKPQRPLGSRLSENVTNQNLECLTFEDESLDMVITSDVMEHVRLDDRAHREIFRVLRPGGVYLFTVPHERSWNDTLVRVEIADPDDPTKDTHLLEPEYHGDTNSEDGKGVLAYRTYGRDIEAFLADLGFDVEYCREDMKQLGIMNTELFFCRKRVLH